MPLYPEIDPFRQHHLAVDEKHTLYLEESGNPDGIAVVFVHGGPGGGCDETSRRFFDPARYRIVTFDQRGAGRSTPYACLENNTTWDLVSDLEKIREHLRIEKWLVFGGSWGSTLALCYAQCFSERVIGLVLRGIFLCRERELAWLYQEGASRIYPDFWQDFIAPIPASERDDLIGAYYRRLTSDDPTISHMAAKAWAEWEGRIATLLPNVATVNSFSDRALAIARIECHYFVHQGFLKHWPILAKMDVLAEVPGIIVQGRYDMVCPAESAFELHQVWPSSRLHIIDAAGHSAGEREIAEKLVRATDLFAEQLTKDM